MSKSDESDEIDHDALFKLLLKAFFPAFVELFIPDLFPHIDPGNVMFLDKEVFADLLGKERRESDIVARVRFRESEVFFLLLCEPMSYAQSEFPARLLLYLAMLYKEYRLKVYPIVLYSYDKPYRAEPNSILFDFPHKVVLSFNYDVVQLNRLNWQDFVDAPNPVASALMAKMRIKPKDKAIAKAACMKMMLSLDLNREESRLIAGIVHSYIKLTPEEIVEFHKATSEFDPSLKEKAMVLTNPWEELGLEKGLELGLEQGLELGLEQGLGQGLEQGLEQGLITEAQKMTLRHIVRRFGNISEGLEGRVRRLSLQDVENMDDALFDFSHLSEVEEWLNSHTETEN